MLIERKVLNMSTVGEKNLNEIKTECIADFSRNLKGLMGEVGISQMGTYNYKLFNDSFASKISYNSKNIVFEETLYNSGIWGVEMHCARFLGLWETNEATPKYEFKGEKKTCSSISDECVVSEESEVPLKEILPNFYKFFGLGEFPAITITVIRIGNVDHYFYTIHR